MAQDEWLDVVDKNDSVIGKKLRSEIYADGDCNFRVVNVFLKNSKGQLWIPTRTANKKIFPSALDFSMGGHVDSGESYLEACTREVFEELNMVFDSYTLVEIGSMNPYESNISCFSRHYEIQTDIDPEYNQDDYQSAKWMYPSEVASLIIENNTSAKSDLIVILQEYYLELKK